MINENPSTFLAKDVVLDDEARRDYLRARAVQYRWMGLSQVAEALESVIRERDESWAWAAV